jgi:hypothetical protein
MIRQRDGFQSERVYLLARFVHKISAACELWIFHPSTAGAATLKTFVFAQPVKNFFLSIVPSPFICCKWSGGSA